MGFLRRHITYANVASTIALALAIGGGTVYAAGKIGGSQIEKGAVRSPQIKNREVKRQDIAGGAINSKKVSNQSLTGKDVREDSLTGHDVEEGSLGLVPFAQDARTVNGAALRVVRAGRASGASASQVFNEGGLVALLSCPGGTATLQVQGAAAGDFGTVIDPGGTQEFSSTTPGTVTTDGLGVATVRRADGTLTRLDFELLSLNNGYGSSDDCFLNAALVSGK
jgi:hypothetical protein